MSANGSGLISNSPGTLYWDVTTGSYYILGANGQRQDISGQQATQYAAQGWQINSTTAPSPPQTGGDPGYPTAPPPATGGGKQGPVGNPTAPDKPAPISYDPQGGGPTYTPGISFGQGTIPGSGDNYQRQWFDVGPSADKEGLNQSYYNDPGNWGYAWDKVLNQFGGQVGGDFYKFLQGFSNTARGDFQNSVPYDPNLNVSSFLDQYAPQIKGVYGLLPSSQTHGGTGAMAGRAAY